MSKAIDREALPYRPAAGVMLLNREGKVWVGQRLDSTLEAWQMPQGGLDPGEEAEDGALRELEEETGIPRDKVEILARAPERAALRSARRSDRQDLEGQMARPAPDLVPDALPRRGLRT